MPKRFDPYHAWLGIPAEEQPPNHYRLLGISLFESNDDVIQNGLDQRMAHVKSFANGPHAAESQRLLTDLSQAGVCLLRPEKKQAYDQQLRSRLLATAAAAPVQLGPAPPPASPDGAVPIGPPPPVGLSASPGTAGSPPVPPEAAQAQSPPSSRTGFPMIPTSWLAAHRPRRGVPRVVPLVTGGEDTSSGGPDQSGRAEPARCRPNTAGKRPSPGSHVGHSGGPSRPDARRFTAPDSAGGRTPEHGSPGNGLGTGNQPVRSDGKVA